VGTCGLLSEKGNWFLAPSFFCTGRGEGTISLFLRKSLGAAPGCQIQKNVGGGPGGSSGEKQVTPRLSSKSLKSDEKSLL